MSRTLCVLLLLLAGAEAGAAREAERVPEEVVRLAGRPVTVITVAGNRVTREWVITREIRVAAGEPLDPAAVGADLVRLENLGIFGSVTVTAEPRTDGVALEYAVTEVPSLIPFPAVVYTEENGFSVGAGVASSNFLGRRITLSGSAIFGGTTTGKFVARDPWITGNHVSAGVEAWHQVRRNELLGFEQTTDRVGLETGMYLGDAGRLRLGGGFYRVGADNPDMTLSGDGVDELWTGVAAIGLDTRDSWRAPTRGWNTEFDVQYFGGDAGTLTAEADVQRYLPLASGHALATGALVSLQSGEVGEDIPAYLQYFLGGSNSIRGYDLEQLGREIFGRNQLLYTLEYRYNAIPLRPMRLWKWSLAWGLQFAAFGDAGTAWSRSAELSLDRTRVGFGAGVRLLMPAVEMIRFDFGVGRRGDVVFNLGVNSIFIARKLRVR